MSGRNTPASGDDGPPRRQRLDKWLWFARFARTRPLAARHIGANCVRVNGRRVTAAGYQLKLGDMLTLGLPHITCVVRVCDLGQRRGPAPEARLLYETTGEPVLSPGAADEMDHDNGQDRDDATLADGGGTG